MEWWDPDVSDWQPESQVGLLRRSLFGRSEENILQNRWIRKEELMSRKREYERESAEDART